MKINKITTKTTKYNDKKPSDRKKLIMDFMEDFRESENKWRNEGYSIGQDKVSKLFSLK